VRITRVDSPGSGHYGPILAMRRTHVEIRGAATHNLKRIDVDVPLHKITVVTGVSGSGKSSLAIDTLYAEGQRRFIESLSPYARQFLDRMERPEIERMDFIPPAIAIGQTSRPTSARATVGSMSQLSDLLHLLFGAIGEPFCPNGHGRILPSAPTTARARLVAEHDGKRATIVAPVSALSARQLIAAGHLRAIGTNGEVVPIESLSDRSEFQVVIDRLVIRDQPRLAESIGAAFRLSKGRARIDLEGEPSILLRESLSCEQCGFEAPDRDARLLNPSSPLGACPTCEGFGRAQVIDRERVVPDPTKSLLEDAIAPWSTPGQAEWKEGYHRLSRKYGLDLKKPWQDLSTREQSLVFDGDSATAFPGVRGFFAHLERKRYRVGSRILIARYRGFEPCETCRGKRLKPGGLAYRVLGLDIAEVQRLSVSQLIAWLAKLAKEVPPEVEPLVSRIASRAALLEGIGLAYLTLHREGRTLSAGEARRVHLSSALGAGVTGALYVLDEPSIGLHARDTERLARLLRALTEAGNTVVVVEHDTEIIESADRVIELGPRAGKHGGQVIFSGDPAALQKRETPTGRALRGTDATRDLPRAKESASLLIRGARARSLKELELVIPLGALTCITGVSGSGKSTLLHEVLAKSLPRAIQGGRTDPAIVEELRGAQRLKAVHLVDTSPLARSVRSIPATYLDAWTPIRAVLATSSDAKRLGLEPGAFSFNSGGGRCETCQGLGSVTVDMQFLADITVACDQCSGKRFSDRVLKARWRNKNVFEILSLTIDEASELFHEHAAVRKRLAPLIEVGLGYLELGQSTATLSGGEAQRLKLAMHLSAKDQGPAAFLFDEPTTGLHNADIDRLLGAFAALLAKGATLVVVEHNLEVIRHAHHVIDLGPEGGEAGGRLVVEGSIFDLMDCPRSHTGAALAARLRRANTRGACGS
jgi:excinuclease ABC subunit A